MTYSDADWQKVVEAPMIAGFAITAADPSSFIGTVQESIATAKTMGKAHGEAPEGSLIANVVRAYEDKEVRTAARATIQEMVKGHDMKAATAAAMTRLGETAHLVRDTSPEEADAFLKWLQGLTQHVAEAGTEGGFLGFGGEKVSELEKQTLAELQVRLGLDTTTA